MGAADDSQPSPDGDPQSTPDPDGLATYGENDLVPEPHKVRTSQPITGLLSPIAVETVPHTFIPSNKQPPGLGVD